MARQTIVLDFDGVIHSYTSGWPGDPRKITDPPVKGAREAVDRLLGLGFEVKVHSSRCKHTDAVAAIRDWLKKHDIRAQVVKDKPPGVLYVDDRGYRFGGDWGALLEFAADQDNLTPWNKKDT